MTLEILKADVAKLLVENNDFPFEAAATAVEDFSKEEPEMFHADASAESLADYLATNGEDD